MCVLVFAGIWKDGERKARLGGKRGSLGCNHRPDDFPSRFLSVCQERKEKERRTKRHRDATLGREGGASLLALVQERESDTAVGGVNQGPLSVPARRPRHYDTCLCL